MVGKEGGRELYTSLFIIIAGFGNTTGQTAYEGCVLTYTFYVYLAAAPETGCHAAGGAIWEAPDAGTVDQWTQGGE